MKNGDVDPHRRHVLEQYGCRGGRGQRATCPQNPLPDIVALLGVQIEEGADPEDEERCSESSCQLVDGADDVAQYREQGDDDRNEKPAEGRCQSGGEDDLPEGRPELLFHAGRDGDGLKREEYGGGLLANELEGRILKFAPACEGAFRQT